jgi:hypothetical protein
MESKISAAAGLYLPPSLAGPVAGTVAAATAIPRSMVEAGRRMLTPLNVMTGGAGLGATALREAPAVPQAVKTGLAALETAGGGAMTGQGLMQAAGPGPPGETPLQQFERRTGGVSQALMGAAGVKGGIGEIRGAPLTPLEQGRAALEPLRPVITGIDEKFMAGANNALQKGHLSDIARQYQPQTISQWAASTGDYASQLYQQGALEASARHPEASISGDDLISNAEPIDPVTAKFFPDIAHGYNQQLARFEGKNIPLPEALSLVDKLNAMTRRLHEISGEDAAAMEKNKGSLAGLNASADAVRELLYQKLEALGEPGIKELQQEFGGLKDIQAGFEKTISKSIRVGEGPNYSAAFMRALAQKATGLIGAAAAGAGLYGHPGVGLGTAAVGYGTEVASEMARIAQARAKIPNVVARNLTQALSKVDIQAAPISGTPRYPIAGAQATLPYVPGGVGAVPSIQEPWPGAGPAFNVGRPRMPGPMPLPSGQIELPTAGQAPIQGPLFGMGHPYRAMPTEEQLSRMAAHYKVDVNALREVWAAALRQSGGR